MTEINEEAYEDFDTTEEADDPLSALNNMDFNVKDEYKPDPLVPKGTYHGVVNKVTFNPSKFCIIWDFCLHDNGGLMNDGETEIDGSHVYYRNWLPKPGDENVLTKSGKNNKRQSKINMLRDFGESLGIDISTPRIIAESIQNAEWVGIEADLEIDIQEYQGKFSNQVNRVRESSIY